MNTYSRDDQIESNFNLARTALLYELILMNSSKKPTYLFSDAHFGAGTTEIESEKLEKMTFLLDEIVRKEALCYILGDLFDFWFEFRGGLTRGFDEVLKALRTAVERGAKINLIGGNHDWWAGNAFERVSGVKMLREPIIAEIQGKLCYLAHGDGLAQSDWGYRNLLKPTFRNSATNWLFRQLPRSIGQRMMSGISSGSKLYTKNRNLDMEAEYVFAAESMLASLQIDAVIIGHTHEPARIVDLEAGQYVNIGDFFDQFSYAVIENSTIRLEIL